MKNFAKLIMVAGIISLLGACNGSIPDPLPHEEQISAIPARILASYNVYFDVDSVAIDPEAQAIISRAARDIKSRKAGRVVVTGYADRAGKAKYNLVLSKKRARATAGALRKEGVDGGIIQREAMGEKDTAYFTPDDIKFKENRRVSIVLYK